MAHYIYKYEDICPHCGKAATLTEFWQSTPDEIIQTMKCSVCEEVWSRTSPKDED